MKCPACSNNLSELSVGSIKVDVCSGGCGGTWFDPRELAHVDEKAEIEGEKILAVTRSAGSKRKPAPIPCPRCKGEPLVRQYFDPKAQIELDLCWSCGGIFLDCGELATIRNQFATAKERQEAGDKFVSEVMAQHSTALNSRTAEVKAELASDYRNRFRAIVSVLRGIFDPQKDGIIK